jgi:hypothetical protein
LDVSLGEIYRYFQHFAVSRRAGTGLGAVGGALVARQISSGKQGFKRDLYAGMVAV